MTKFKTIEDVADEYVKANRLESPKAMTNVKNNFLQAWRELCPQPTVDQVVFVDFDKVWIDHGEDDLEEVEI